MITRLWCIYQQRPLDHQGGSGGREIYAPEVVIWHDDDLIEQPVAENLKVLAGLRAAREALSAG